MTKEELQDKIIDLKAKNTKVLATRLTLGLAGSVGGVIYASKKGKGFWGKVGYWFLGGLIVGVPTALITNGMVVKNVAEIEKAKNDLKALQESSSENQ